MKQQYRDAVSGAIREYEPQHGDRVVFLRISERAGDIPTIQSIQRAAQTNYFTVPTDLASSTAVDEAEDEHDRIQRQMAQAQKSHLAHRAVPTYGNWADDQIKRINQAEGE